MKKIFNTMLTLFSAGQLFATEMNTAAFFRTLSPSDTVITEFDPFSGTLSWSNSVAGVTNQLQRAHTLSGTNNWIDFVQLVSASGKTGTVKIIDHNPPNGMVLIPGGMNCGTNPLSDSESYNADYGSSYLLRVDPFYMDSTEVTKQQWDLVYNWAITNGYIFDNMSPGPLGKGPDHPVCLITSYDCVRWCNARSEMEGRTPCYTIDGEIYKSESVMPDCSFHVNGYRLPTDVEWEFAARGGLVGVRFPWGDTITHSNANYYSANFDYDLSPTGQRHPTYNAGGSPYTSPAGSFPPNNFGVYDMVGNVAEWHWPTQKSYMDIKGGYYNSLASQVRCGYIDSDQIPVFGYIGFRTVISDN